MQAFIPSVTADKPQSVQWHADVMAAVMRARATGYDADAHSYSDAVLAALEPLKIRGSADGYEFNGYDYDRQTWLTIIYDK